MSLDHSRHDALRDTGDHTSHTSFWKSKAGIVTCGFLLIGAFFLLTEHWAHVLGVLPYLLILACPLMHVFMHRGHGGHGGHHDHEGPKRKPESGGGS